MKNQYFGDINDYRKYGLLRQLADGGAIRTGVCWMLTENDGTTHGNKRDHLTRPQEFRKLDSPLFDFLDGCNVRLTAPVENRGVRSLEASRILPGATFFSDLLSDNLPSRDAYFAAMLSALWDRDLIFFDPDTGLENKSPRRGNIGSCKFLYFEEVGQAFNRGHSLLIYQHLAQRHMSRDEYRVRRRKQLFDLLSVESIIEFCTPFVSAFLVPQERHRPYFAQRAAAIEASPWAKYDGLEVSKHQR